MCGNLRICLLQYFICFLLLVYELREELVGEPLDLLVRVVELDELGVVQWWVVGREGLVRGGGGGGVGST